MNCVCQINVYPAVRHQVFRGFGGAFTEAAAYNYQKLSAQQQKKFMQCYFGHSGLRYTVGRTHINSCDFALGNYACIQNPEDSHFDTSRDEQYILPMIRDAQLAAQGKIGLLLSPWSPPAFMKTNQDMNNGGKLKPEYWELWAECMAKYAAFYREHGCDVRMISVQNEPAATQTWDSCLYDPKEEGAFAVCLRKALKLAGCDDMKILTWDHNKEALISRAIETMAVPGAEEAVDGFAVHWYTGDHFQAVQYAKELWRNKDVWFTEGCVEYSRFDGMSPLEKAEMYAHDILGNLNAGISGSIDWNLLLDAKGGPNHVGNFCEAPVMLTEEECTFEVKTEYYYIGHFSRYIQSGAVCLGVSSYTSKVEAVAFQNPDGSLVAVLLNRTEHDQEINLTDNGSDGYRFLLGAHSIATLQWQ